MKKKFALLFLLLISCSAFSLPVEYIKGSFIFSKSLDKIYFSPTDNKEFNNREVFLIDNWLKQRLIETNYIYSNLVINLAFIGQVRQTVKGCFNSWFKKLEINSRLNLMEHLKPNPTFTLTPDDINYLSNSLNKYTIDNSQICKNDNILGDITTTYITIDLEQYLTDKSNNKPTNEKYNDLFERSFDHQYKNHATLEINKFQNWIESLQNDFSFASTEVIAEYVNLIQNLKFKIKNETEASFLFIIALNNKTPNLKEYLNNYSKIIPFTKSSKLLFEKCFDKETFLSEKCSGSNIGNNFSIIQVKIRNKFLNHLIWTGQ